MGPAGAAVGEDAGVEESCGRRRKGAGGVEEVAVEGVVGVLGDDLGLEEGFGVVEFVVGNEGGEEGEERGEGEGEGGVRGGGLGPLKKERRAEGWRWRAEEERMEWKTSGVR